jgi:hydrogenase nickel incorporation protein HypA/HybF
MHEVGLMHEALQIALVHARRNQATRVHAVTLRIGPLAGVDVEALRQAFEVIAPGTLADGAVLHVEVSETCCWCDVCRQAFQTEDWVYRCPRCGQVSSDVRQGREFDVVAVEVS